MAMSKSVLGKTIADLVVSSDAPAESKAQIESLWTDIAGAIIDHITANAEITVNTTVAAGIAVSATGAAGPVAGATTSTGTGTGTATIL